MKIADFSYNIDISPSDITANAQIETSTASSKKSVTITGSIQSIEHYSIDIHLKGDIPTKVESALLYPLMQSVLKNSKGRINDFINDYQLPTITTPTISVSQDDVSITLNVNKLKLSTYKDMLLATGDIGGSID